MFLASCGATVAQFDGLEGSEKRPAQPEAILHSLVQILRAHYALANESKGFSEQRTLEPIEITLQFERLRLRGLTGARDEFHLAAMVQNLRMARRTAAAAG
jgi:hypothetical protein